MSDKRKTALLEPVSETLDNEIARYEAMSDEEIDAELAAHGINATPTVEAVKALLSTRVKEWRSRRVPQRAADRGPR